MKRLAACLVVLLIAGSAFCEPVIKKILVTGLKNVSEEKILLAMESRREAEFSSENVRKDILNIYALGSIADVSIYKDDAEGGINLIVKVQEKPVIRKVTYNKADEISTYDLETEADFKSGAPFEL